MKFRIAIIFVALLLLEYRSADEDFTLCEGLEFNSGVPLPPISVNAVDIQQNTFHLPLEIIAFNLRFPFTLLIVPLPENLSPADLMVTVTVNGQPSNSARISIKP